MGTMVWLAHNTPDEPIESMNQYQSRYVRELKGIEQLVLGRQ